MCRVLFVELVPLWAMSWLAAFLPVKSRVLVDTDDFEVLKAVVLPVTVLVVNLMPWRNVHAGSSKNSAMLKDIPISASHRMPRNPEVDITVVSDAALASIVWTWICSSHQRNPQAAAVPHSLKLPPSRFQTSHMR